jgi:predicted kinase
MKVVVLVGLPGSGKSTYLERAGAVGLSSDAVRKLLADDETDQTIHERVFQTVRFLLRQRLEIGRAVTYIDATNLRPEERKPYVEIVRLRSRGGVFRRAPRSVSRAESATLAHGAGRSADVDGRQADATGRSGRVRPGDGGAVNFRWSRLPMVTTSNRHYFK